MVRARYVSVALLLALSSTAHAQDFDPRGHRHTRPPAPRPHAPSRGAGHDATTTAEDAHGPTQAALIERYTRVVLSQPGSTFPLERLAPHITARGINIRPLMMDVFTA